MKTLKEILNEKLRTREKDIISLLGGQRFLNRERFEKVQQRLWEDPSLDFLATLIGTQVWNTIIDSYHNPKSPMESSQAVKVAFAEVIMIWEESNNSYNAQLVPAPPFFSQDDLRLLDTLRQQLKETFPARTDLSPQSREYALVLIDKLFGLLPPLQ